MRNPHRHLPLAGLIVLWALGLMAVAQDIALAPKAPSVSLAPPDALAVAAGKTGKIMLHFRVEPGFHINSNTPKSDFLIPTALKMEPPTDVAVAGITYPAGEDMSFPFSPDEKLNVYSGDFAVEVAVKPLRTVAPGQYTLHGVLRYQACDNSACYPPKKLPVDLQVKVAKGAITGAGKQGPAGTSNP
jgi:hypothetical protein